MQALRARRGANAGARPAFRLACPMQRTEAMKASLVTYGSILLSALTLAACGSGNGGAGGSGGAGGAGGSGGTGSGTPTAPPQMTGIALVDRLGAAAAACGKQSVSTVPGGWQNVAVGDKGCMVWVPPGWIIQGSGTAIVSAFSDTTGTEGFVGVAGATQALASCKPQPARDSLLDGFTKNGYSAPQVLWHVEGTESFGGSDWTTGQAVFSMTRQSTPLLGYLWVLTLPTVVACDVVGLGFWEPEANIDVDTCKTLQILSSVTCPSGGGCDPVECNQSCINAGHQGGTCESGCVCI
jgi:hypothetical protein